MGDAEVKRQNGDDDVKHCDADNPRPYPYSQPRNSVKQTKVQREKGKLDGNSGEIV